MARAYLIQAAILSALALMVGCAVSPGRQCAKDGESFCTVRGNFTGRWFDHYERALSCMEGECYEAALEDLQEALERNTGEKRWTNTYGMHFIDYFPRREKGIVHYLRSLRPEEHFVDPERELLEAAACLERSIAEEPSEKARFFLDKVRKRRMELRKAAVSDPTLRVEAASAIAKADGSFATAALAPVVVGTAEDPQYVSSVIIDGVPLFMEGASRRVRFEKGVDLPEGDHVVAVEAANLLGGRKKRDLRIRVDRSGPAIIVESFVPGARLRGRVFDDSAVVSLLADGRPLAIPSANDGDFSIPLAPGIRSVEIRATDELGNETLANVKAKYETSGRGRRLFATNDKTMASDAVPESFRDSGGSPEIHLHGWPEEETVFLEAVEVAGRVKGIGSLVSLSISVSNDRRQDVLEMKTEFGRPVSGRTFFFDRVVPLGVGRNTLEFRSVDEAYGQATKTLRIVRRIPGAFRTEHRFALGLHPFDDSAKRDKKTILGKILGVLPAGLDRSRFLTDVERGVLQAEIFEDMAGRKRFRTIRKEGPASSAKAPFSAPAKDLDAVHVAKQGERADALLFGNTAKDRHGVEIVARVVDVRTSEIMATVDAYSSVCTEESLAAMAGRLSEKIHRAFPLSVGAVSEVNRTTARADFEENAEIRRGWPMLLFRRTARRTNPVTRVSLGSDAPILGDAAMGENGIVLLEPSPSGSPVPGDGVVCR